VQVANTVEEGPKLLEFLKAVLPDHVPYDRSSSRSQDRDEFIQDVLEGMISATMAIRITQVPLARPAMLCFVHKLNPMPALTYSVESTGRVLAQIPCSGNL
jgi:hypothetical protein